VTDVDASASRSGTEEPRGGEERLKRCVVESFELRSRRISRIWLTKCHQGDPVEYRKDAILVLFLKSLRRVPRFLLGVEQFHGLIHARFEVHAQFPILFPVVPMSSAPRGYL